MPRHETISTAFAALVIAIASLAFWLKQIDGFLPSDPSPRASAVAPGHASCVTAHTIR
ncbi:hypothetical protein [Paraburkholderia fungorum]|uniref:hypothetical protein n=1 Tax=Paraburkholderia fungorum TaxID=134537 RepID=UPI0038BC3CA6